MPATDRDTGGAAGLTARDAGREGAAQPRPHLIDGEFQSDKYPTTPRGKVPLSCRDQTAQDLLWEYAQRRRAVDAEFADDLEVALRIAGYRPVPSAHDDLVAALRDVSDALEECRPILPRMERSLKRARAALVKAEGREP
jgi:hypothetical protein